MHMTGKAEYEAASGKPQKKYPFTDEEYGGLTIHNAVLRGIPEVVLKLVEVREGVSTFCLNSHRPSSFLRQGGVGINVVGNGGATPLHMAAISEPGQHIVDTLLRLGADAQIEDEHGYTPLHRFVSNSA
jgi:ankyrin repeat protein